MPFIPNEADAPFGRQSYPESNDFEILKAGFGATGIVSGCAVTAQATPDMTVAVASGQVIAAGAAVTVTSGNVAIAAAHPTEPRTDIVIVNSSGGKSAVAGAPGPLAPGPAIPANSVVLASVYVPAADTAIEANQINTDKRMVVIDMAWLAGRAGGQTLIGGTGAADFLDLRGTSANLTQPVRLLSPLRMAASPNNTIQDSGGTARITLATAGDEVTINPAGVAADIRLNDRIGIGIAPLATTVLRLGIPSGMTVVNQMLFAGTRTSLANGSLINFVNFSTAFDAAGFIQNDIRAFAVQVMLDETTSGGSFDEAQHFRLSHSLGGSGNAVTITDLAYIAAPHPTSPGIGTVIGTSMGVLDIGDFDDINGSPNVNTYGIRIGNRGGRDPTHYGANTLSGTNSKAHPIWQQTVLADISGATSAKFYNVLGAPTTFGLDAAPSNDALIDIQGKLFVSAEVAADVFEGLYAPGSQTIPTGSYTIIGDTLSLSGSETFTLEGDATVVIV